MTDTAMRPWNDSKVEIETREGRAPGYFFRPRAEGKGPAVIIYMDAFGVRPALCEMASRLAGEGCCVLLPNLYYRAGPMPAVDPAGAFKEGPARERLLGLFRSLSQRLVMEDTAGFLDFLARQAAVEGEKIGCVGYCMGGAYALSAAGTFPERIAAAASFHGARLASDQPDSPHLLAPRMRAEVYVGVAGIDPHFTPEEKERLGTALRAAGVVHQIEVYEGVKHGFAVNDTPVFDRAAAEVHWQRLRELFGRKLGD
jgi:carboxymethylenebutenolidase